MFPHSDENTRFLTGSMFPYHEGMFNLNLKLSSTRLAALVFFWQVFRKIIVVLYI